MGKPVCVIGMGNMVEESPVDVCSQCGAGTRIVDRETSSGWTIYTLRCDACGADEDVLGGVALWIAMTEQEPPPRPNLRTLGEPASPRDRSS
jgi:hypothetical protein